MVELRAIAAQARAVIDDLAAGATVGPEECYRTLQSRAASLNARFQWASSEEFETLLPTLDARSEMQALNEQYGVGRSTEQGNSSPIEDLLTGLWGWATGVLVAYEQGLD